MPHPKVSILIPCWGCKGYVREAIFSALAQDYPCIEVIVVEDHGSDGTYEAALSIDDDRLRVFRNSSQLGQYGNKNRALELSSGSLIKYLDGDDLLEPDAVSNLVDGLRRHEGAEVVFGRFIYVDENGRFIGRPAAWGLQGAIPGLAVLDWYLSRQRPASPFGNVTPHLFARAALERIGGFPHDNAGPGDLDTFIRFLTSASAVFLERPTAKYRIRSDSMSMRTFGLREATDYIAMVDRLQGYFEAKAARPSVMERGDFFDEWRVWATSHIVFASLLRALRGRPNEFARIRKLYYSRGLGRRFDLFVTGRFLPYLVSSAALKVRRAIGCNDQGPFLEGFKSRHGAFI